MSVSPDEIDGRTPKKKFTASRTREDSEKEINRTNGPAPSPTEETAPSETLGRTAPA